MEIPGGILNLRTRVGDFTFWGGVLKKVVPFLNEDDPRT
jgi:hypothetical protein